MGTCCSHPLHIQSSRGILWLLRAASVGEEDSPSASDARFLFDVFMSPNCADTPAVDVLSEAIDRLTDLSDHVLNEFDASVARFEATST